MNRLVVIDRDRRAMEGLGLACLPRGIAVAMAENICEGVRLLLTAASLIVVDAGQLRLTPREYASIFERVAPGVPVMAVVEAQTPLTARVALELAGFRVLARPVTVEELIDKEPVIQVGDAA